MVQKLGNKTCPFCSRHVVACAHQIRRKRTWESLLKTIWGWESQPYQVSNMNHTLSKLPIKLYLLVCQVCCCDGARIILLFLFAVCRAPNRAPMRVFFFFAVCRAPNRALLCGSWPGVSFGNCCWRDSMQCLQSSIFLPGGIDSW